jgi:hypothetical protein
LSGIPGEVWALPEPVGSVNVTTGGASVEKASELLFRAGGYLSRGEAWAAGEILRNWLRLANVMAGFGFDCGEDIAMSMLGAEARITAETTLSAQGKCLVDDVHGLTTYEEKGSPTRFSLRGEMTVGTPIDSVREAVIEASKKKPLDVDQVLACELFAQLEYETSNRQKLLTTMTALEAIAKRRKRDGEICKLIDTFIEQARKLEEACEEDGVKQDLLALIGGLGNLKSVSIAHSLKELVLSAIPNNAAAAAAIDNGNRTRGKLTHGEASATPIDQLVPEVRAVVREVIDVLTEGK